MEIIKSVQIRKFRSIKSVTKGVDLTDLNIFVGQNDQGKSNFLRALNIFFNDETDRNQPFRFIDDYCYHSNTGKGTRHEIRIDLVIHPPKHRFKHAKPLRWMKQWRQDGSISEERKYLESGEELPPRDNVSKWLDKIRYRYVPAIKGQTYFSSLMGELHDVLNEAHSDILNAQGEEFISGIQEVTDTITQELTEQIQISNTIQVPSDFKQLFSNLDFGVKVGTNTYHLKQRGDGIKIRHIPVILKYMSEQERNISRAGYVKPDTIWGFEEPENNLELRYAYELAEKFKEYSKDIQIFVTTHSPAFYALDTKDGDGVNTFYVSQGEDSCTKFARITHDRTDELHETMGLLPIITPYLTKIFEHQKEISKLEESLNYLQSDTKCVVLTEDENHGHVIEYFGINGFNNEETEYFAYNGSGNITGAIVLARYLKSKDENISVIIHRDRDYLSDKQVGDLCKRVEKHGFHLFVTDGVDIESLYISTDHILELHPELTKDYINEVIEKATDECRDLSVDRLIDHVMSNEPPPEKGGYSKRIKQLNQEYDENKIRYRYGKRVLGKVSSKIQRKLKENPVIVRESDHICSELLIEIANDLW
ncbi:MAG: ATP-binding protein [Gammaproteobacteria bacterium]|nr:ATP-binding protein [Gammaproteobacteria bacterium]